MKKLLFLGAVLFTLTINSQTKVDLSSHGLKATVTIPSEYGEAKVDSSTYSSFTTWTIKAGKKFKMKIKERNKKPGVTPEQVIATGKKELEGMKSGKVTFVKYVVEEKNALIFETKATETNASNFSMVYVFMKNDKMYEITSGISVFTEADCKAMLEAAKNMKWN
ncbi:MAG: hypothetical protein K0S32_4329 [Bacteroidetes bacterium]|jgi:hypothetical protein|nr:hypothetical protein [Bacteroidota bacterium]